MNDSIETLAKRIEELESQAAFQDELHESLNATVAKQDGEILALQQQLILLIERFKELCDATSGAGSQDEMPPHY